MDTSQNLKLLNMAKRNVTLSVILVILAVVKISLPLLVPANSDNYLYDLYMLEHRIGPLIGAFSVLLVIFSSQIAITSWTRRGKNLGHGWSRRIYP